MNGISPSTDDSKQLIDGLIKNPNVFWNLLKEYPELASAYKNRIMNVNENASGQECKDYSETTHDPTNSIEAQSIFFIIYFIIFILGLVGNLSIVGLTLRYRHLRTVQNIFILNLAIADVIVCLLSVPLTPITNTYKVWLFGRPLCHLLPMVQAVSIFVSTLSLSAIAIDRFNLVVRPHAQPLTVPTARNIGILLWVLSALISLPYAYFMNLESYETICDQFCTERWPSKSIQRGYALVVLILQFLLPFLTMSFCYSTIFSRLRDRANSKLRKLNERSQLLSIRSTATTPEDKKPQKKRATPQQSLNEEDSQRINLLAQQRRTTSILASMVLIFGLTWLPHNVYALIMEYDEQIFNRGGTNYTYLISIIVHCISMLTNVANPILYAWLNPKFKELFIQVFKNARLPDSSDNTRIQREASQKVIMNGLTPDDSV